MFVLLIIRYPRSELLNVHRFVHGLLIDGILHYTGSLQYPIWRIQWMPYVVFTVRICTYLQVYTELYPLWRLHNPLLEFWMYCFLQVCLFRAFLAWVLWRCIHKTIWKNDIMLISNKLCSASMQIGICKNFQLWLLNYLSMTTWCSANSENVFPPIVTPYFYHHNWYTLFAWPHKLHTNCNIATEVCPFYVGTQCTLRSRRPPSSMRRDDASGTRTTGIGTLDNSKWGVETPVMPFCGGTAHHADHWPYFITSWLPHNLHKLLQSE